MSRHPTARDGFPSIIIHKVSKQRTERTYGGSVAAWKTPESQNVQKKGSTSFKLLARMVTLRLSIPGASWGQPLEGQVQNRTAQATVSSWAESTPPVHVLLTGPQFLLTVHHHATGINTNALPGGGTQKS